MIALVYLHPWTMGAQDIFAGGEDILYLQTNIVEAAQVGPFGTDPHLAYPTGDNLWSFPVLGIAILAGGWLLSGVLGLPSGAAALTMMALTLAATAGATLFLFRGLIKQRSRWLAAALATALALSPFFFSRIGHLNVATIFVIPLALGLLLRAQGRSRAWLTVSAVVVFVGVAISPLWWGIVLVLMLVTIGVGVLLQRSWQRVIAVLAVGFATCLGLGIQVLLFRAARVPGLEFGRGEWASTRWGGQLTDILVSSPLFNELYPKSLLKSLRMGASNEFAPIGLVCAAFFVILLLLLIKSMPQSVRFGSSTGRVRTTLLIVISTVTLLFFFTGALGNAQSAAAVMLGTTSPARVFSRMSILAALLGMAWFLLYFTRWRTTTSLSRNAVLGVSTGVAAIAISMTMVDVYSLPRPLQTAQEKMDEYAAVSYLQDNTQPCPVAQLPQDGAPIPRIDANDQPGLSAAEFNEKFSYRGLVPYLMADQYFWSIGSYNPSSKTPLTALGSTLTPTGVQQLKAAGFCAILFDKELAATNAAKHLEGSQLAGMPPPNFSSPRFDVYLVQ